MKAKLVIMAKLEGFIMAKQSLMILFIEPDVLEANKAKKFAVFAAFCKIIPTANILTSRIYFEVIYLALSTRDTARKLLTFYCITH